MISQGLSSCVHWFCNYISVLQIICILVVPLQLVATSEICSPCVFGISTKPNHAERSCDHAVPVDSITNFLNTTINKFNILIQSIVSTQFIILISTYVLGWVCIYNIYQFESNIFILKCLTEAVNLGYNFLFQNIVTT